MSPERLTGGGYSFSADVWSLGMVLYELLCRVIPFAELKAAQIMRKVVFDVDKLPDLAKAEAGAPEALVGLMRGCCATKPEDRPTAEDVSRGLQDIRGAEQAGAPRSDKHHRELVEMLGALAETVVGAIDGAAERTEMAVQKFHRG
jgi:serine/threonine protein kinase